jgi:hypothetical protein
MVRIPKIMETYSGSLRTISKPYLNYLEFSSNYLRIYFRIRKLPDKQLCKIG